MRIVGIAGSLRTGSFNAALLRAAVEECPHQATIEIESNARTPEYNNSIPGVFKNAIDWMTRPASDIPRVFRGRPVGLIGASPGAFGTVLSQAAWLPVLRTLGMRPWFGQSLYVGNAAKVFDASGRLVDDAIRARLRKYLEGFVEFAA
jgi:NAD(P)H-dependent FMN reductase